MFAAQTSTVLGRPITFWTRFALIWLMVITVTGAGVRLTGSGLGCLDWPNCTANEQLDAPSFHSAIEFGNRVISGLAILPLIAAAIIARRERRDTYGVIAALVAGFIGQVVLGMLVTRTELDPRVVLGHFLLSIVLIFLAVLLDVRVRNAPNRGASMLGRRQLGGLVPLGLASVVIVLGTLVTGSGPHTGSAPTGEPIPRLGFDITDITRIHSLAAWALVASIVAGMWVNRNPGADHDRRWFTGIGALAIVQGGIGYLQFAIGVPASLVAVHIVGSVLLWTLIAWYAVSVTLTTEAVEPAPATTHGLVQ